jgi:hypothetical protein
VAPAVPNNTWVGHALRGVRPAGFAAVARLLALPSAGSGTPFGLRRPRAARGSPRRLRRRGPAPGPALRRLGNPVRAPSATRCAGFAPPASPPWPGSGPCPPPAREPRSGLVGHGVRGVRPAGFAAVARLRALPSAGSGTPFGLRRPRAARGSPRRLRRRGPAPGLALRRLGNPVRASSATVCAGFAPPASPPWPGSGPCPPPAREPRSGSVGHALRGVRPAGFAAVARLRALPSAGSGTPFGPRRPRCARGSPRRLRRRGPAPGLALRRLGNPAGGGLPSQARSTRLNVQPGRSSLARSSASAIEPGSLLRLGARAGRAPPPQARAVSFFFCLATISSASA